MSAITRRVRLLAPALLLLALLRLAVPALASEGGAVFLPLITGGGSPSAPITSPTQPPLPTAVPTAVPTPTPPVTGACVAVNRAYEEELLRLVNVERAKVNVAPLRENASLTCAARWFAQDIANHDRRGHIGTDGSTPEQRMLREGYTGTPWSEVAVLGRITPAEAVQAWMDSPGHRFILLDANVDEAGLGYGYYAYSIPKTGWIIDVGKSR